ncbi:unnamed protein product [Spirodela intermedia]|uniref:Uncharacterized protein n=1 Tax=Spirodela intermedia TaxID=51605 RepID=A0A7I8L747_SPIIN|nr:unnamed protein product [Spirodela intermedia]
MTLLVEVVSHEAIRPSAATPAHLRRIQLSVVDQGAPATYVQSLSFFRPDGTAIHTAAVLPPLDLPIGYLQLKAAGRFPWRLFIRAPEMAALRGETCGGAARPPTRYEATPKRKHLWVALLPVNLRKRIEEFSSLSFGNLAYAVVASAEPGTAGGRRGELEASVREAVRRVDAKYLKDQIEVLLSGGLAWEDDGVDTMEFSEWSRLGMHKTDFGWGLPVWHCTPMKDLENFVVFGEADGGAGMEAWLWLPGEVMERLREDPEVLRFVDPDSFSH